jgi:copper chaperone CopZ
MLSNKYTQIPLTFGTFGNLGTSGTSSAFFKLFTITFFLLFINAQTSQAQQTTITDSFRVEGVCISCKNRIEKVLKVKGVNSATWRISDKILTINYQPGIINLEQIETRIADVGHDTPLKKAKDEVYNKLPDCCLYKDPENEGHLDDNDSDHEHALSGVILSEDHKGNINPLPGATVSWLDGSGAVMANDHGVFTMPLAENKNKLVISYTVTGIGKFH